MINVRRKTNIYLTMILDSVIKIAKTTPWFTWITANTVLFFVQNKKPILNITLNSLNFELCPKISSIHFFINYSIFMNTSGFKWCPFKSMNFLKISPLKLPFTLPGFNSIFQFSLFNQTMKWYMRLISSKVRGTFYKSIDR